MYAPRMACRERRAILPEFADVQTFRIGGVRACLGGFDDVQRGFVGSRVPFAGCWGGFRVLFTVAEAAGKVPNTGGVGWIAACSFLRGLRPRTPRTAVSLSWLMGESRRAPSSARGCSGLHPPSADALGPQVIGGIGTLRPTSSEDLQDRASISPDFLGRIRRSPPPRPVSCNRPFYPSPRPSD